MPRRRTAGPAHSTQQVLRFCEEALRNDPTLSNVTLRVMVRVEYGIEANRTLMATARENVTGVSPQPRTAKERYICAIFRIAPDSSIRRVIDDVKQLFGEGTFPLVVRNWQRRATILTIEEAREIIAEARAHPVSKQAGFQL